MAQAQTQTMEAFDLDRLQAIGQQQEPFAELQRNLRKVDRAQRDAAGVVTAPVTASPRRGRPRKGSTSTMSDTQPAARSTNAPTLDQLLDVARDLGTQAGQGKDVQIKFDLKIIEGGYLGSLDITPDKHGDGVDDATKLAEAYAKAQNTAVIFDAKAANQRKLVSTVRKGIKLGCCPKWGQGEPLSTVNNLITLRQQLRKDPANLGKLEDAHNMVMRFATSQLKRDQLIDGDELKQFAFKRDPNARSAEQILENIRKTANNLRLGKVANCPDMDTSPEVQAIVNACTKRLSAIAKSRGKGEESTAKAA